MEFTCGAGGESNFYGWICHRKLTRKLSNDHDEYLGKFKSGITKSVYHCRTARPTIVGGNIINRKMTRKDAYPMMSGGGGIRTPEEFPLAGFQDRCNQPGSATPPN